MHFSDIRTNLTNEGVRRTPSISVGRTNLTNNGGYGTLAIPVVVEHIEQRTEFIERNVFHLQEN
jgi:hypothetical protein